MRIIDPHVHVYKNDPAYPWAPETRTPPKEDATPEMLLRLMEANGVEKTVLVQVIHYRWDNRFVADTLRRYPDRFMGVCRVNPEDPAAPDHLRRWVEEHGLHGVRLSPAEGPEGGWFTGPMMDPLFARAGRLRVPMLILTRPGRLPDLARLLERHGDLDVCVDHMADCHPDRPDQIQKLLDLARFSRVFVKISHTWPISKQGYPWADTHEMVKRVIDTFGVDRCMWGTDWPVCLSKATYAQTLGVVRDEMRFLSEEERGWLLSGSVLRLWPFT